MARATFPTGNFFILENREKGRSSLSLPDKWNSQRRLFSWQVEVGRLFFPADLSAKTNTLDEYQSNTMTQLSATAISLIRPNVSSQRRSIRFPLSSTIIA